MLFLYALMGADNDVFCSSGTGRSDATVRGCAVNECLWVRHVSNVVTLVAAEYVLA